MKNIIWLLILVSMIAATGQAADEKLLKPMVAIPADGALYAQAAALSTSSLSLEVRADKDSYLPGEPVVLYVSLKNNGKKTVTVNSPLDPEYGFVDYFTADKTGNELRFLPLVLIDVGDPKKQLEAGKEILGVAKIFYGGNGWTFRQPGSYRVYGLYDKSIKSNTITIQVDAPGGNDRAAADLFLGSDEVGKFLLFEGGDHLQEGIQRLKKVAEEYPESAHAFYANYCLGNSLMTDFSNFQTNELRRADPAGATRYLESAKAMKISPYYTVQTYLDLSVAYELTGQPELAQAAQSDLKALATAKLQTVQPMVEQMQIKKNMEIRAGGLV